MDKQPAAGRLQGGGVSLLGVLLAFVIGAFLLAALSRSVSSLWTGLKSDNLQEEVLTLRNNIAKDATGRLNFAHIDADGVYVNTHGMLPENWTYNPATKNFTSPDGFVVSVNHFFPGGSLPAGYGINDAVAIHLIGVEKKLAIDLATSLSASIPVVVGNGNVWFRGGGAPLVNMSDVLSSYPDNFNLTLVVY